MPWTKNRKGGYRKKGSNQRGGNIKRPKMYEALRRRGMGKRRAARIANSKQRKGRSRKRRK